MSDRTVSGGSDYDDPESPDAAPLGTASTDSDGDRLDVTPRTDASSGSFGGRNRGRTYAAVAAVAVIVVGIGIVLMNGLRDASTFFYNVDEVSARQDALQGERIRMQGNVVDGSVHKTADGVSFVLRFGGDEIPIDHVGDPPELFGPKIPVVLEGTLEGGTFHSDQILVRHDSSYDEENQDRIRDAERDAEGRAPTTTQATTADSTTDPTTGQPERGPALGGASG